MKKEKTLNGKFTALLISLSLPLTALTASVYAAEKTTKRWFEVEVILFEQLGDKSALKEQFVHAKPIKKPKKFIELLDPFLHSDISNYIGQIPICGQEGSVKSAVNKALAQYNNAEIAQWFQPKTLTQITQTIDQNTEANDLSQNTESNEISDYELTADLNKESANVESTNIANASPLSIDEMPTLTAEQQVWLTQADQWYQLQLITSATAIKFTSQCWLMPTEHISMPSLFQPTPYTDYQWQRVPVIINATEQLASETPYLNSADSLQLTDIFQQLKRSRDFKPVLHLGWRLAPENRFKSKPLHLFAGENLALNYQQQLAQYQQSIMLQRLQQNSEHYTENAEDEMPADLTSTEQQSSEKLANIINQLISANQPLTPNAVLALTAEDKTPLSLRQTKDKTENLMFAAPVKPPQDWAIEGFFKVHLNHYLFITADFSLANNQQKMTPLKVNITDSPADEAWQIIPFSQNRRVISGEIHYFDHPYLGMIVQIRRFEQPESTD